MLIPAQSHNKYRNIADNDVAVVRTHHNKINKLVQKIIIIIIIITMVLLDMELEVDEKQLVRKKWMLRSRRVNRWMR